MVKKNEFENVHSKNGCDGTRSEKNSEKKKRGDSDAIEYFTIFLLESTEKPNRAMNRYCLLYGAMIFIQCLIREIFRSFKMKSIFCRISYV